jgi:hypothetical protein
MSGKVLAARSLLVVNYPNARLLVTDRHGKPVSSTRVGEVLRFEAVAPKGAALTKSMRVCLEAITGNGDCAPPNAPCALVRRVQPENVVKGRVTADVVEFSRTWATTSIPVAG